MVRSCSNVSSYCRKGSQQREAAVIIGFSRPKHVQWANRVHRLPQQTIESLVTSIKCQRIVITNVTGCMLGALPGVPCGPRRRAHEPQGVRRAHLVLHSSLMLICGSQRDAPRSQHPSPISTVRLRIVFERCLWRVSRRAASQAAELLSNRDAETKSFPGGIVLERPQGPLLAWVDWRKLGMDRAARESALDVSFGKGIP
ncbi:hypothetical protein C7974DRAFT_112175 [Boeremia exigua]|uniref:uncharacterized protein n=1 Tax=Boeremia exigua TaxID=749465 RepID=UPI001E8D2BDC|nr:uncharacterized protein C7974DRAFT_112175 [Boeremia exigua]KAH6642870.1 hypothetical protein C7974DRAFT_112175 [Boeremia exigua]